MMNMVITNFGKHVIYRCRNPNERKEFLKRMQCFLPKSENKMESINICYDKYAIQMEHIKDFTHHDHIPGGCCAFHQFQECVTDRIKELCGDEASDYFQGVID